MNKVGTESTTEKIFINKHLMETEVFQDRHEFLIIKKKVAWSKKMPFEMTSNKSKNVTFLFKSNLCFTNYR